MNVKMKLYLIKLNSPLLINNGTEKKKEYTPLYGFYYTQEWSRERRPSLDDMNHYLGYLAAVHEWSNNSATAYSVESADTWIDKKDGEKHSIVGDLWSYALGEHCRRKLDLGATLYVLDIEEPLKNILDEGCDGHFIISEHLMDELLHLVEEQRKKRHRVCLFNRPIWLPKKHIWEEEGHCHIYGVITDDCELDDEYAADINLYLGYLALCEEYCLTGTTPNGYCTINGETWYKDGIDFNPVSKEMREECSICLENNNLNTRSAVMGIPAYDLAEGTRDDLIIDQELYERLLSASPRERTGCQE